MFAFMVGITLGLPAGYFGGRLDTFISFLANLVLAFPVILLFYLLVTPEIRETGKTRRGDVRAFVDLFNAYGRTNVLGYDHRVTVSGTTVTDTRKPREQLPFLPSAGVSWEF